MKFILAGLFCALVSWGVHAQQSPCNLITDQQLADMNIMRSNLFTEYLTVPKEVYGTQVELKRSDCRYAHKVKNTEQIVVLLSLADVPSQSDQRKILESVGELLLQMQKASQGSVPSPSSINVKVTKNEQGWCSDSANRLTGTMVGCSEIGNGRFIVANYFEEQSTKDPDTLKKRAMNYFDLILSKISAIR